ncbi:hypothetical protein N9H34_00205 [bacterium]|nr:hypothetical protein [bacterium]
MKLAVTGVGIVSPLGNNIDENMRGLLDLDVNISDFNKVGHYSEPMLEIEKAFHCNYDSVDTSELVREKDRSTLDPNVITSLIAANDAVKMSGLDLPEDTPVVVGTVRGGSANLGRVGNELCQGKTRIHPNVLLSSAQDYVSNHVSSHFKLKGPSLGTSAACVSSIQALDIAKKYMQTDGYTAAIVGGTEFMANSITAIYFQMLGASSKTNKSTPWDKDRDGLVIGEGSVYVVVEPLELAEARGANIRWVIDGIGIANDAAHVLQPDKNGTGARIAIEKAMKQADTQPRDYKVFNAHATSTPTGDPIEYDVLKDIFLGGFLYSNKGQLGHMMGASGLTELVLGAEAMRRGFIPGNAGLKTPFTDDKYFTLKEKTVTGEYHRFMKTSFGFGGRAAAVSVRKA